LNTLARPTWPYILRVALVPGAIIFSAVFVPWILPLAFRNQFASPHFIAILQALVVLLFLLLVGFSLRFNRRNALFQTLALALFWLGIVVGGAASHPWILVWTSPVLLLLCALFTLLPDRRLVSVSSLALVGILLACAVFIMVLLKFNLKIPTEWLVMGGFDKEIRQPWQGSWLTLVIAALSIIFLLVRLCLQPDHRSATSFWLFCMVFVSLLHAVSFVFTAAGGTDHRTEFSFMDFASSPLPLYVLSLYLAYHGYSLLENSYHLAYHDQLTGLPGRRALDETLAHPGKTFCLAMADVDKFKSFNDTYGHDVGDQVLRLVAATLATVKHGKAFRYGGEEFVLLFPGLSPEAAVPYAEDVRAAIGKYRFVLRGKKRFWPFGGKQKRGIKSLEILGPNEKARQVIHVTVSIGLASRRNREEPAGVLKRADEALYQAKESGRNRLITG